MKESKPKKLKPFILIDKHPIVDLVSSNANKSIQEIEELIFNYMQMLDEQFPDYENMRFLQEKSKDGKIKFTLFGDERGGFVSPKSNVEKFWKKRDGKLVKISDMDDGYLDNAIKFAKRKITEAKSATETFEWNNKVKDLEEEAQKRVNEVLKVMS